MVDIWIGKQYNNNTVTQMGGIDLNTETQSQKGKGNSYGNN